MPAWNLSLAFTNQSFFAVTDYNIMLRVVNSNLTGSVLVHIIQEYECALGIPYDIWNWLSRIHKLKVIVVIFGRKTLLELSFTQVTKE